MTAAAVQANPTAWNIAAAVLAKADAASDAANDRYYRARTSYTAITGADPWGCGHCGDSDVDAHVDRLTGMSGAGIVSDKAMDAYADAADTLILTPAPDLAALLWKMEHLFGETANAGAGTPAYCAEWGAALMDDARRLLTGGMA